MSSMTKNEIREEFWNGGLAIHAVSHKEAVLIAETLAELPGSEYVVGWWEKSSSHELEVCKYGQRVSYMPEFGWHVANGFAVREANIAELLSQPSGIKIQTIDDLI